jgi:hypothetical protein
LNDTLERVVDNVTPRSVKFEVVTVLTSEVYQETFANNKYVLVNYHQSDDQISLIFSKTYEKFARLAKQDG